MCVALWRLNGLCARIEANQPRFLLANKVKNFHIFVQTCMKNIDKFIGLKP